MPAPALQYLRVGLARDREEGSRQDLRIETRGSSHCDKIAQLSGLLGLESLGAVLQRLQLRVDVYGAAHSLLHDQGQDEPVIALGAYGLQGGGRQADAYPTLKHHLGDRIDVAAIRDGWNEALRVGVSIEDRVIAPSGVLKKLSALPKNNPLSRALREIGRIERTLFMIEWYSNPDLRDRCRIGLNKGEAGTKLTRAVFVHERGEIRDGSFESQAFRASGLNLVVSSIIYWNTVYLSRAVDSLRAEGHDLPDHIIRHISPQIWEHINLTGIYDWLREPQTTGTFRPLRTVKERFRSAA